jgi:hypothetical protein
MSEALEALRAARRAPNDRPESLPPASLKLYEDAKARNEYLQEIPCYWNPEEVAELIRLKHVCSSTNGIETVQLIDYRVRCPSLNVKHIPTLERSIPHNEELIKVKEAEIKVLEQEDPYCRSLSAKSATKVEKVETPETKRRNTCIRLHKEIEMLHKKIRDDSAQLRAIKAWIPVRRIKFHIAYNDHKTDTLISQLKEEKEKCPTLIKKLIKVIKLRKEIMAEMNKSRGNPMRNVYLDFCLTPMDYRIDASWTIHRSSACYDWEYVCYHNHITEYDLSGEKVKEYKSKETLARIAAEAKEKERDALKSVYYEDIFTFSPDNARQALGIDAREQYEWRDILLDIVQPNKVKKIIRKTDGEELTLIDYFPHLIVNNINYEDQTADVIGYLDSEVIDEKKGKTRLIVIPAKEKTTLQFPAKHARAKQSKLEKILKPLQQWYDVASLL